MAAAALSVPAARAESFGAMLSGYNQVPPVLSGGTGSFTATVDRVGEKVAYSLGYEALEAPIVQAELHFGPAGGRGGVVVFLCSNYVDRVQAMPLDVEPCPSPPAKLLGEIEPLDVMDVPGQGIRAGEFDQFLEILSAGAVYITINTSSYPAGELRGQIGRLQSGGIPVQ